MGCVHVLEEASRLARADRFPRARQPGAVSRLQRGLVRILPLEPGPARQLARLRELRPGLASVRGGTWLAPVRIRSLGLQRFRLDLGIGLSLGRDPLPLRDVGDRAGYRLGLGAWLRVGT